MQIEVNGEDFYLRKPILFEPVWHPFVSASDKAFQEICGGEIPSRGDYSQVEWVAKALDDAKNLIMNGLSPQSIKDHGGDREDGGRYFGDNLDDKLEPRKIKIKEARKKGLLITNKWKWD